MFGVRFRSLALCLLTLSVSLTVTGCGESTSVMKTTAKDLADTPQPPMQKQAFEIRTEENPKVRDPNFFTNRFPLEERIPTCEAAVNKLEVFTDGITHGGLAFFTNYRGNFKDPPNYTYPETNDNFQLGSVSTGNVYLYYKYMVEITFAGELDDTFYGQMSTKPMPIESRAAVEFHDWTPTNDAVGREWNVPADKNFTEFKKRYPVVQVEKDTRTVRFIEAPGGAGGSFGIGWEGKKMYVMVYAGTCGRITKVKVYKIVFPAGKKPVMTEVESADDLLKEQSSFTFSNVPFPH